MKQFATWLLVAALLLLGGVPWAMAATQIQLKESDGSVTPLQGVAGRGQAKVTLYDEDGNYVAGGGGGGSATEYTEDAAAAANPVGGVVICVRRDTLSASEVSADGDNVACKADSMGRVHVNTGTTGVEDAAETAGGNLNMIGSVRRDTAASSAGATGDNATINTDSTGRLWTNTELPDAAALADATSNPTTTGVASYNMCFNGTTWDRCVKADSGSGAIGSSTQRMTLATDSPGIKAEDSAHASADSGYVALTKRTDTAASSAGTDGDYATFNSDASGRLWVNNGVIGVEDAAETAGGNLSMVGTVRRDTAASSAGTTGDNATLNTDANGYLWTRPASSSATGAAPPASANYTGGLGSGATGGFLIGFAVADTFANVNVSTATTTLLVTGVSGRHVRITSLNLLTAAANNVALISGTGATCGTGTTGMNGGTTAASGWNFPANGGLTQGNGLGSINQTNATGDSVCIVTSAATQLSGRIGYAIY